MMASLKLLHFSLLFPWQPRRGALPRRAGHHRRPPMEERRIAAPCSQPSESLPLKIRDAVAASINAIMPTGRVDTAPGIERNRRIFYRSMELINHSAACA